MIPEDEQVCSGSTPEGVGRDVVGGGSVPALQGDSRRARDNDVLGGSTDHGLDPCGAMEVDVVGAVGELQHLDSRSGSSDLSGECLDGVAQHKGVDTCATVEVGGAVEIPDEGVVSCSADH